MDVIDNDKNDTVIGARVPRSVWQAFKAKCQANKQKIGAVLKDIIIKHIEGQDK